MSAMQIIGPVLGLIALGAWLTLSPNIMAATDSWYSQTRAACVVEGERFDRVVDKGSHSTPEDAWKAVSSAPGAPTGATIAGAVKMNGSCDVTAAVVASTAEKAYTPSGTELTVAVGAKVPTGGTWKTPSPVFTDGGMGPIIKLILQAANVAPPLAIMTVLGLFGVQFMGRVVSNPIVAAVTVLLGFMLVAVVLNAVVPFLDTAYYAVNPHRFAALNEGLGVLGPLVRRFWGVLAVAGILIVGWQIVGQMRAGATGGKNAYGGM